MNQIKRALVTGGAGFIGSHLVDALVARGVNVCVLDNLSTGRISNLDQSLSQIEFFEGDIRDHDTLTNVAKGCDAIFHQAAVVSVPQSVDDPIESASVNIAGTVNVLDVARKQGLARVIFASSCAVYGDDPIQPKKESLKTWSKSPYALQKRVCEMHAQLFHELYGLESICLRYFNVFGPRQDPSSSYSGVISIFMDRAVTNQAPVIYGDGRQSRDFIYVQDVVRANLKAAVAKRADGLVLNVGSEQNITINALWGSIKELSGTTQTPKFEESRKGDIQTSLANIQRAREALGFHPKYKFKEGLQSTYSWYVNYAKRT